MLKLLWLSLIAAVAALPSIYLVEPRNSDIYLNRGFNAGDVKVQYQLFNLQASDRPVQFCYDLFHIQLNKNVYEGSCVQHDVDTFVLHDLEPGRYMLTSYLKQMDDASSVILETKVVNHFNIEPFEQLLPKLSFVSSEAVLDFLIVDEKSNTADISFEYALSESMVSAKDYQVCVFIAEADSLKEVLPLTCLDSSQRLLSLRNINKGSYKVELTLKDLRTGTLEESSRISKPLQIKPLVELLPVIHVIDTPSEYMLDSDTHTAEVSFKYELAGNAAAMSQIRVCLRIDKFDLTKDQLEQRVTLLDTTCVPRQHNIFTLSRMTEGRYSATLSLQNEQSPSVYYATRDVLVNFEIRPAEEFLPSYEWRTIHEWNTIPAGIITRYVRVDVTFACVTSPYRLPLSGSAVKEGRIPDPWKLQLSMPSPCKYFLRMDVYRDTTIQDIR